MVIKEQDGILMIELEKKEHLEKLRFQLELMSYHEDTLNFMLCDKDDVKFSVLMQCGEVKFKTFLSDNKLNEDELFEGLIMDLMALSVSGEHEFDSTEKRQVLKDLLAYFLPESGYLNQKKYIEAAILIQLGHEFVFEHGDHETRTPRVSVTGETVLKGIDFIVNIHGDYYSLDDSDEYHKMVNQSIWKALLYMTDIMLFKGIHENRMTENFYLSNEVTREGLLEIIPDDLNYFDHEQIKDNLRRFEISPDIKQLEFKSVLEPIDDSASDYNLSRAGSNLILFRNTLSVTYRNYLIRKGLASEQAIAKMQEQYISVLWMAVDTYEANSFQILDGLYTVGVKRDPKTKHIHLDLILADEVLDLIEQSTVLAC